jgi:hypothetical protein
VPSSDNCATCARRDEAGELCENHSLQRKSKGELRAETTRLRKKSDDIKFKVAT